jgi:hypothetical protein
MPTTLQTTTRTTSDTSRNGRSTPKADQAADG